MARKIQKRLSKEEFIAQQYAVSEARDTLNG